MAVTERTHRLVLHCFIVRSGGHWGAAVLLAETEPGQAEFPWVTVHPHELDDEPALVERIGAATGLHVSIARFLDPPTGSDVGPPGSRFVLARAARGEPRLSQPYVGWEWRPQSELAFGFVPPSMANELRQFMSG